MLCLMAVAFQSICYQASAQYTSISFYTFGISDGLSQSSVFSITEDSLGFAWLATADGLNRFDGKTFKVFRNELGSEQSLPDNFIMDLGHANGNLFVLTSNQVSRLHTKTEKINRIGFRDARWKQVSHGFQNIHLDTRGNAWICGWSGLFLLEAGGESLENIGIMVDGKPLTDAIYHVFGAGDSLLYLGLRSRILEYNIKSGQSSVTYEGAEEDYPKPLLLDRSGRLWIALSKGRLLYRDVHSLVPKWTSPGISISKADGIRVHALYEKGKDDFFAATIGNGLIRFRMNEGITARYRHQVSDTRSLPSDNITSIHRSKDGTYLIGTDAGGLATSTLQPNPLSLVNNSLPFPRNIHEGLIKSLFLDDRYLWYGTAGNGLGRYELSNGNVKIWHPWKDIATFGVWSITRLESEKMLFGGNGSLHLLDLNTGVMETFSLTGATQAVPRHDFAVNSLLPEGRRIWIGTLNGVLLFDLNEKRLVPLPSSLRLDFSKSSTLSIAADKEHLYFGTYGSGILKWHKQTGTTEWILFENPSESRYQENTIRSLHADDSGLIWAGTNSGLRVIDSRTWNVRHFTTWHGLPNNFIYGIQPDGSGNMWVSSNGGLSKVRITEESHLSAQNFTPREGLQSLEFNTGAYSRRSDGLMAFGGINGINLFYPDQVRKTRESLPVYISSITHHFEPLAASVSHPYLKDIVLKPHQNEIAFEYNVLSFRPDKEVHYRYRLDPIDTDWVYNEARTYVRFINLEPGSYTFRVMASSSADFWEGDETRISILILTPYWETTWFRVLSFLGLLLGIGFTVYRATTVKWRQRMLQLERENEINQERNRISSDLHDKVGARLTRISLLSELIRTSKGKAKRTDHINEIYKSTREVITQLDEIVWTTNPQNDTLERFVEYMIEYTTDFFRDSPIRCRFDIVDPIPDVRISSEIRHDLYLCISEALANVMKHSAAKTVRLHIGVETGRTLMISIEDDGIGMSGQAPSGSNGIRNMEYRVSRHGGTIAFESGQNPGTIVRIMLDLPITSTQSSAS